MFTLSYYNRNKIEAITYLYFTSQACEIKMNLIMNENKCYLFSVFIWLCAWKAVIMDIKQENSQIKCEQSWQAQSTKIILYRPP
jgi:hypothetical protein